MASVFDYTFQRLGNDNNYMSQDVIQSSSAASYMLDGFVPHSPASNAVEFATNQNHLNFTGGKQVGIGGFNIDENTTLSRSSIVKSKCRLSLMERPFATVPFLGRGKQNAAVESQIIQGDLQTTRKSINPSSEVSYLGYSQTPMLSSLKSTISNPSNLVEGVAVQGWVRGGVPSREFTRETQN